MWVCVRRPVDGDTVQKRAETLEYVEARLSGKAKEDELVMVAFGLKVGLYNCKRKDGGLSLELRDGQYVNYSRENALLGFEYSTLIPLLEVGDRLKGEGKAYRFIESANDYCAHL
jgi:hypothetical protein